MILPEKAYMLASEAQGHQKYGTSNYNKLYHLTQVADRVEYIFDSYQIANNVTNYEFFFIKEQLIAAAFLHDIIEDSDKTFNDIKNETNKLIADIVFACSEFRGRNRKERKPTAFFEQLIMQPYAPLVKGCDFIVNMTNGIRHEGTSFYTKEAPDFLNYLESIPQKRNFLLYEKELTDLVIKYILFFKDARL